MSDKSDIKAEAEKRFPSLPYLVNPLGYTKEEYDSLHGTISEGINQRRTDFIAGYSLASKTIDEKDEEIKRLINDKALWLGKYYNADELLTLANEKVASLEAEKGKGNQAIIENCELRQEIERLKQYEPKIGCDDVAKYYDDEEDDSWQPCDNCDFPDACAHFGCAIKAGIKRDFTG